MACSFRGAGSPSYSLEIQWWYIKDHRDWQEKPAQITNNVSCGGKQVFLLWVPTGVHFCQLPGGRWKAQLIRNWTWRKNRNEISLRKYTPNPPHPPLRKFQKYIFFLTFSCSIVYGRDQGLTKCNHNNHYINRNVCIVFLHWSKVELLVLSHKNKTCPNESKREH